MEAEPETSSQSDASGFEDGGPEDGAEGSPVPGGDLSGEALRRVLHAGADLAAEYLERVGEYPVLPSIEPGELAQRLPLEPPLEPEPWERILGDYRELIEPAVTHWNHPGFFAYFAISGSAAGVVGETLAAALNVNAMLWRTSPAATELEERVCDWLRQMVGLPEGFCGHINDTASIGTLLGLAAARHRARPETRERGLAGQPPMVVYASDQAHSSVDKAAMTLGLGLAGVRRIRSDGKFRLDVAAMQRALKEDRASGLDPIAVVATAGTTSTTSVDPLAELAALCDRESLWLHVDAAYAGAAAVCPEYRGAFRGWERADSVIVNPHKWLFVPVDCSVLFVRDRDLWRQTFSVVPAYLQSAEAATNLMDLGIQLGRRFRALKLWMVIRHFGVDGLRSRIRHHCRMAQAFASRVAAEPGWEVVAPFPFSVVCFRCTAADAEGTSAANTFNRQLLERVNREGGQLLSATELRGRSVLRLAIGNLRTEACHVEHAWAVLRAEAHKLAAPTVPSGESSAASGETAERR